MAHFCFEWFTFSSVCFLRSRYLDIVYFTFAYINHCIWRVISNCPFDFEKSIFNLFYSFIRLNYYHFVSIFNLRLIDMIFLISKRGTLRTCYFILTVMVIDYYSKQFNRPRPGLDHTCTECTAREKILKYCWC